MAACSVCTKLTQREGVPATLSVCGRSHGEAAEPVLTTGRASAHSAGSLPRAGPWAQPWGQCGNREGLTAPVGRAGGEVPRTHGAHRHVCFRLQHAFQASKGRRSLNLEERLSGRPVSLQVRLTQTRERKALCARAG